MQVSHLQHSSAGFIKCACCDAVFEVRSSVFCNPEALVSMKESIAAKHTCRKRSSMSMLTKTRVLRMPTTSEQLSAYFDRSVRRYIN